MIKADNNVYVLETENTSYIFRVMDNGLLEHVYYGRKLHGNIDAMAEKHAFAAGNTIAYNRENTNFSPEQLSLEISARGKGDIREPYIELVHADGSTTSDFVFESAKITEGKQALKTLPSAYGKEAMQLSVNLKDSRNSLTLKLIYSVFEECDVITRSAVLVNNGAEPVRIERILSMQLDMADSDYELSTFNGAWTREMNRAVTRLAAGRYVNESCTGTSSSRANPFFMLGRFGTDEDKGECLGFNLIYSGNHYEALQADSFGKLRIVSGINPATFSYVLTAGGEFETPEAVMTYSYDGYNAMSHNMHKFIREHIVRGAWKSKPRPVLLNSWEAAYFDINENKLLKLAKAGKDVGIELFVMDDGWFGKRNDDTSSLGDWYVNQKKLPGGLKGLSNKLKNMGLMFGIWVEPEMVNVDSDLYRAHPDWTIETPGGEHSEGRNQRILDLGRDEVCDYIIEKMTEVFSSANISYVKWDMNRIFSDYYSNALPPERQGETAHRYVCGLYRCMDALTKRFPDTIFEGCAAGGNRFDLGILCYFPQIWASDNTDAVCRAQIQYNYSYGYPMSVISAHVSASPNHQTLRNTPLETRFAVAAFGLLGYECNLCDMSGAEIVAVREQIRLYKEWRNVLTDGTFYRISDFGREGDSVIAGRADSMEWNVVSADCRKSVGMTLQKLAVPNQVNSCFKAKGLLPDARYHFYNRELRYNIKDFGDLVNTASPVHIKPNSVMQDIVSRFVKMDGETEDYTLYGDVLMYCGVRLKQNFAATGFNSEVRYYQDFGARMYFMEETND